MAGPEEIAAPAVVVADPAVPVDGDGFLAPPYGILPEGYADRFAAVGAPPHVRLLSRGAEPRSILRYTYKKGDTGHIELTTDISVSMEMGARPSATASELSETGVAGDSREAPLPAPRKMQFVLDCSLTVTAVDASGNAEIEGVYRSARVRGGGPAANAAAEKALQGMAGTRMTYRASPSGNVSDFKMMINPALQGPARDTLEQVANSSSDFATPLPEVPIGVGATWISDSRVTDGGLDLLRQARTTLDAIRGTTILVNERASAVAASPQADLPKLPPGATAAILALKSRGAGWTKQGLGGVAELEATAKVDADYQIRIGVGDETTTVRTAITMDVAIKPLP